MEHTAKSCLRILKYCFQAVMISSLSFVLLGMLVSCISLRSSSMRLWNSWHLITFKLWSDVSLDFEFYNEINHTWSSATMKRTSASLNASGLNGFPSSCGSPSTDVAVCKAFLAACFFASCCAHFVLFSLLCFEHQHWRLSQWMGSICSRTVDVAVFGT